MGADERFNRARMQRERDQFDASLAQSMKNGDDRAMSADRFGQTVRPGDLLIHTPTVPPTVQVMGVSPVLDPRMPAGAIRLHLMYEMIVPAGQPIQEFFLMGSVPKPEVVEKKVSPEVEVSRPSEEPAAGPRLVVTDAD